MPDASLDPRLLGAVATLLGAPVAEVTPLGGGRNSRVLRVRDSQGRIVTAKAYHRHPGDDRDRLGTEFAALRFLWREGLRTIPRPLACDPEAGVGLMEWVEGSPVTAPGLEDIDEALAFLGELRRLGASPDALGLSAASEACFSLSALLANLRLRLDRLGEAAPGHPDLAAFLRETLEPAWKAFAAEALGEDSAPDTPLPASNRLLSPSDFGFHNALRRNGSLVFLDFEYFGWDDPAKTLVDVLLHPAMALPAPLARRFAEGFLHRMAQPGLCQRARRLYPLYGLKWCLILLNEFLPGPLERRTFAHPQTPSPRERQAAQLQKARLLLATILDPHARHPLFPDPA